MKMYNCCLYALYFVCIRKYVPAKCDVWKFVMCHDNDFNTLCVLEGPQEE